MLLMAILVFAHMAATGNTEKSFIYLFSLAVAVYGIAMMTRGINKLTLGGREDIIVQDALSRLLKEEMDREEAALTGKTPN